MPSAKKIDPHAAAAPAFTMSTDSSTSTSIAAPATKRPRRLCAMCLTCNRTGSFVAEQTEDTDRKNFVPTGGPACPACDLPTFDRVDRETVEYSRYGDTKLTSLIFDGRFEEALRRVRLFPLEANTLGRGDKNESALHWAAYDDAPLELLRELVRAGPDLVSYSAGWHEQGTPLDIILNGRMYPGIAADTLEKVRIILSGDPKASISLFTAYTRLVRHLYEAMDDEKSYPDGIPADLAFIEEEIPDEGLTDLGRRARAATTLTFREQCKMMLDAFVLIAKAGYYGSVDDCDGKPLLHALVAFPYQMREDSLNWTFVPHRVLKLACRLSPEELSLADDDGNLPLHLAVAHRTPYREKEEWEIRLERANEIDLEYGLKEYGLWWLIHEVPTHYSKIDLQKDDYDRFNSKTIELLLEKYPEAIRTKNEDGDLPLHLAIKARKTKDIIQSLVEAYPDAIRVLDGDGNTCLHLLAQQMPGSINVKEIFEKYEEDLHDIYCFEDEYPPGVNLISSDKDGILDLLIQKYPEACSVRNSDGLLPYQCFVWNEAQNHWENVLRFMNEEVATTADEDTGLYPFMEAADVNLAYRTLQKFPSVMERWNGN